MSTLKNGVIKIVNGTRFKRESVHAVAGVVAIRCPTIGTCYGLEQDGNIVKTGNGSTWRAQSTGLKMPATFTGLACSAVARCYAIGTAPVPSGRAGIVLTTRDGKTWSSQTVQGEPQAVACSKLSVCESVGAKGTVLRTVNGISWQPVSFTPGITSSFTAVSCTSTKSCFAVAAKGQILTLNVLK